MRRPGRVTRATSVPVTIRTHELKDEMETDPRQAPASLYPRISSALPRRSPPCPRRFGLLLSAARQKVPEARVHGLGDAQEGLGRRVQIPLLEALPALVVDAGARRGGFLGQRGGHAGVADPRADLLEDLGFLIAARLRRTRAGAEALTRSPIGHAP
jgi:hypothetical protein